MVEKGPPGLDQCSLPYCQLCVLRCRMYVHSNPISVDLLTDFTLA
jgi:hypothetical protein